MINFYDIEQFLVFYHQKLQIYSILEENQSYQKIIKHVKINYTSLKSILAKPNIHLNMGLTKQLNSND